MTRSKQLTKGDVLLQVGNEVKVTTLALGIISLVLDSSYSLALNDCLYVPNIIKNIIFISILCLSSVSFVVHLMFVVFDDEKL